MVSYSIDKNPRPLVYFLLAAGALSLSFLSGKYFGVVSGKVLTPSAFAVFGMLVALFDRYLWRIKPFDLLAGAPDLTGNYSGFVERAKTDGSGQERIATDLRIKQTWTRIDIRMESARVISEVRVCGLSTKNADEVSLVYTYVARDKTLLDSTNEFGEGTTELRLARAAAETKLSGTYYSTKFRGGAVEVAKTVNKAV